MRLRLPASSTMRGVIAISSGTLVGQLIVAAATPILSRIYEPEAFGVHSTILAIASAIGPAAALKFDSAIMLPRRDADARGLLILSLMSTGAVAVVAGLAAMLFGPMAFSEAWSTVPLAPLWVFALVTATGVFTSLVQATLRGKSYGAVGWRAAVQSTATTAAQLGLGLLSPTPASLLGGTVIGRGLGFFAFGRALRPLVRSTGGATFRVLVRSYWRSPLLLAPSSLLNAFGSQMPLVVVAAVFGAASAGQLGMAQRLVFLPAAILGAALAQVFGAEVAQRLRDGAGSSRRLYLAATLRISLVAVPVAVIIIIAAPWAMPWLLGNEWAVSGPLAQAMALTASLGLIVSPLSQVYLVHQSAASLFVDGSRIMLVGGATVWIVAGSFDVVAGVWMLSLAQFANYVITWVYGLRIVSRTVTDEAADNDVPSPRL